MDRTADALIAFTDIASPSQEETVRTPLSVYVGQILDPEIGYQSVTVFFRLCVRKLWRTGAAKEKNKNTSFILFRAIVLLFVFPSYFLYSVP